MQKAIPLLNTDIIPYDKTPDCTLLLFKGLRTAGHAIFKGLIPGGKGASVVFLDQFHKFCTKNHVYLCK